MGTDWDKFKLVNDTHGGIQRFATVLKANTRAADICGRLGGDEFVGAMTHGGRRPALQAVESLFADEPYILIGEPIFITASLGIARTEKAGEPTLQELMT